MAVEALGIMGVPFALVATAGSTLSHLSSLLSLQLRRQSAGAIGQIGTDSSLRRSPRRDQGQGTATPIGDIRTQETIGPGMLHGIRMVEVETGMALMRAAWGLTHARCNLSKVRRFICIDCVGGFWFS